MREHHASYPTKGGESGQLQSEGENQEQHLVAGRTADAPRAACEHGADAGAPATEGGCLSNTHPQTSQWELSGHPGTLVSGGLDWYEWSAAIAWQAEAKAHFDQFAAAKEKCQTNKQPDEWLEIPGIGPFRISRHGVNHGGSRGQHYEFKLNFQGVTIGLADGRSTLGNRPAIFVQQTGRDCLLIGALQGYRLVRDFVTHLGGNIRNEKLSRADLTLDIAGLGVEPFQRAVEQRCFITRAKKVVPLGNAVDGSRSGITAGKNPLHLTIYDKLAEVLAGADALYARGMIDRRWGGQIPQQAVRIEFQLSRNWLKRKGVSSPEQLVQSAGSLAGLLTSHWFRLTTAPIDRPNNHQSRAEPLALWEAVTEAFVGYYGEPEGPLVPIQRSEVDPVKLIKQARGCLATAALYRGYRIETYEVFMDYCQQMLREVAAAQNSANEFMEIYRRRLSEHAA